MVIRFYIYLEVDFSYLIEAYPFLNQSLISLRGSRKRETRMALEGRERKSLIFDFATLFLHFFFPCGLCPFSKSKYIFIIKLMLHVYTYNVQERDQRYKELGLRDKITLTSGRFLLGNKYAFLCLISSVKCWCDSYTLMCMCKCHRSLSNFSIHVG